MRRRPHHLSDDVFREGAFFVSLTMCTADRNCLFEEPEPATIIRDELIRLHHERSPVLAYCIMPDHVHAVLINRFTSLSETVRFLKGRTSRQIRQKQPKLDVWQPSYFDHVVLRSEGIYRCLQYVLDNPVRKGLVSNWWEWPWSGAPALGQFGPDMFGTVAPEDVLWDEIARGG